MKKTIRRRPVPESTSLSDKFHPVLKRVLAARQIVSDADLDYSLQNLPPWQGLLGIDTAADLLCEALAAQWRIVIVADFDADGATACTVAVRALRLLGAKNIDYVVPDRFKHGYGLTPAIVEIAAARHPDLLITVDNGISSLEGVRIAKQHGMRVLITDHHLPGDILPQADAIVNPNQPGDRFPGKNFAGVGVIFYVMLALRARLRESGRFANSTMPNLAKLLDLVALGTVADVVPLDYNNRILVSQGLARIRAGECCAGIQALAKISVRDPTYVMAADLAFYLGPRLNAAGRMENMSYGIECLLNDDPRNAAEQARALDAFNQERRVVEADMQEDALEILNSLNEEASLPFGLCLFDEHWHEGVIGILASRIKERLHRPVIVFTGTQEQNEEIKGSARSVPGVHIRDVLSNLSARYPDLIGKFGGHAMAAGLSLPRGNLEEFKRAFDQEVRRSLKPEDLEGVVYSDGSLSASDFSLELAKELNAATPWGQGFPAPVFDGRFVLLGRRLLKGCHLKMRLQPEDSDTSVEAIAFNTADTEWPVNTTRVTLVYRLEVNLYRGVKTLQLLAEYVEAEA